MEVKTTTIATTKTTAVALIMNTATTMATTNQHENSRRLRVGREPHRALPVPANQLLLPVRLAGLLLQFTKQKIARGASRF